MVICSTATAAEPGDPNYIDASVAITSRLRISSLAQHAASSANRNANNATGKCGAILSRCARCATCETFSSNRRSFAATELGRRVPGCNVDLDQTLLSKPGQSTPKLCYDLGRHLSYPLSHSSGMKRTRGNMVEAEPAQRMPCVSCVSVSNSVAASWTTSPPNCPTSVPPSNGPPHLPGPLVKNFPP